LVGMAHDVDHYKFEEELLRWSEESQILVVPAYDGMEITL